MPELDERIERALRESARSPDADPGIVARGVERKKVRRQARRNAATGTLVAAVLVTTAVVTVAIVRRDGGDTRRVSTPPTTRAAEPADPIAAQEEIAAVLPGPEISPPEYLSDTEAVVDMESARGVRVEYMQGAWQIDPASLCRIDPASPCGPPDVRVNDGAVALGPDAYAWTAAPSEPLARPANEFARAPLVTIGNATWVATYDRDGTTFEFPPSHLLDLNSGQQIDLEGEILSLGAGADGTLWAVTRDQIVDTDGTEFRLKRIDANGGVDSQPIPPGEEPARGGSVVTGAGAAWVPVLDGVLRFELATGEYVGKTVLATNQALRTLVVFGDQVWALDGVTLERVDVRGESLRIDTNPISSLFDAVTHEGAVWVLAAHELVRLDPLLTRVDGRVSLPTGFNATAVESVGERLLITGVADLASAPPGVQSVAIEPVALMVGPDGIDATIVIAGGAFDAAIAFEPSGDLLLTSNGSLYRAQLP